MSSFYVTMEQFQGPIERLLEMIEKRKMPINEVSLVSITDEYIQSMVHLNKEMISEKISFIFVASTLTLIKSKSLLPKLELTQEEQGDINELKKRIALLKMYSIAGKELGKKISTTPQFFYSKTLSQQYHFDPDRTLSKETFSDILRGVLYSIPKKSPLKQEASISILVHIEDLMDSLVRRIQKSMSVDFESFVADQSKGRENARIYQIVSFLAMLELVRNGALTTTQEANFSPIHIQQL